MVMGFVDLKNNRTIKQVVEGFSGSNFATVAIGAFICFVSFLGCCGAMAENSCMLTSYKLAMISILIMQISVGVVAFMKREELEEIVTTGAKDSIRRFEQHQIGDAWNYIQDWFQCSGAEAPEDYDKMGHPYPPSCCGLKAGQACDQYTKSFNKNGCIPKLTTFLKTQYLALGILAIVVALVEIIGIMYACCLRSAIDEYELSDSSQI